MGLEPAKVAASILDKVAPASPDAGDASPDEGLSTAAEELMAAIESKSASGIAAALRNAFAMLDSEPHGESES